MYLGICDNNKPKSKLTSALNTFNDSSSTAPWTIMSRMDKFLWEKILLLGSVLNELHFLLRLYSLDLDFPKRGSVLAATKVTKPLEVLQTLMRSPLILRGPIYAFFPHRFTWLIPIQASNFLTRETKTLPNTKVWSHPSPVQIEQDLPSICTLNL